MALFFRLTSGGGVLLEGAQKEGGLNRAFTVLLGWQCCKSRSNRAPAAEVSRKNRAPRAVEQKSKRNASSSVNNTCKHSYQSKITSVISKMKTTRRVLTYLELIQHREKYVRTVFYWIQKLDNPMCID